MFDDGRGGAFRPKLHFVAKLLYDGSLAYVLQLCRQKSIGDHPQIPRFLESNIRWNARVEKFEKNLERFWIQVFERQLQFQGSELVKIYLYVLLEQLDRVYNISRGTRQESAGNARFYSFQNDHKTDGRKNRRANTVVKPLFRN